MVPTQAYNDLSELHDELIKKRRLQLPNVTTALRTNSLDPDNEFGKLMSVQQQLDEVDRMFTNERILWLLEIIDRDKDKRGERLTDDIPF